MDSADKKLKILLINAFFHIEGGVDTYLFNLVDLLKEKGHEVICFSMNHPRNIETRFSKYFVSFADFQKPMNFLQKSRVISRLFWSFEANRKLAKLIADEKPDIAHIHNIHYELSPSIIHELKRHNIPIVMTLHDYVLACPLRTLFVRNKLCEKCRNRHFFSVVINRCIRNSYLASFVVYCSFLFHNFLKTFSKIDLFISPSIFLSEKLKEMNFLNEIVVLPYCFKPLNEKESLSNNGQTIVYFGRLQYIKGIETLIDAIEGLDVTLKIIGRGPIEGIIKNKVADRKINNVIFTGYMDRIQLREEIKESLFTVQPSLWFENYPYGIIESFALSKPVVASRRGGMPEMVKNNETGLLFEAGNSNDLKEKIKYLLSNRELVFIMGNNARKWVDENLNFERHYTQLIEMYKILL